MFKFNDKNTRTTPLASFWCSLLILNKFHTFSIVSIVDFEQVNVSWEWTKRLMKICHFNELCWQSSTSFSFYFFIYIYFCQMKLGSEVYYRISNNKEVILEIKINYLKSYCNCSPRDCRQILLLILGEYKQINYSSWNHEKNPRLSLFQQHVAATI